MDLCRNSFNRWPGGAVEKSTQPLADGVYVNSPTLVPPTSQISSLLPPLVELGGDVWNVPLSQGPGAGIPPLTPPLHDCVTVGRSRSPAAQSGPLTARRIAAPPWSIQPASGARFPRAQSAQSPAPPARGSHPILPPPKTFSLPSHSPPPLHGAHPVGALSKTLPSLRPTAAGCWLGARTPPLRRIECSNVAALPQSQVPPIGVWHRPCKSRHF